MSKININSVKLKNFLSYGNTPLEFSFQEGINVILGEDKDKDRSNGAGKTSFLEAIPFALFGQVTKGIPLAKIVNWKNQKKCEVSLDFNIGDKNYTIFRGIKPGKLELFENGSSIPILSDKRLFQKEIEEDILGMDFKAFTNLIFQNANNSVSMFTTPASEKRKFIENLFNLSVYSRLNELANKKISAIQNKISEIDLEISFKGKRINEVNQELENFFIPDIAAYESKVDSVVEKLDAHRELNEIEKDAEIAGNSIRGLEEELNSKSSSKENLIIEASELSSNISALKSEREVLVKRISSIGDIEEKKETLDKLKKALKTLENIEDDEETSRKLIKGLEDSRREYESEKSELNSEIKHLKIKIKELPNPDDIKDKAECPVCMQECDYDSVRSHVEEKTVKFESEIESLNAKLVNVLDKIKVVESNLYDESKELERVQEKLKKRSVVERKVAELSNIEEKQKELDESKERIEEIDGDIDSKSIKVKEYDDLRLDITNEIDDIKSDIRKYKSQLEDLQKESSNRKELELKLDYEKKTLESKKEQAEAAMSEHQIKTLSLENFKKEIVELEKTKKKKQTLLDYLSYIKTTLKDENVKQHAISNIVPFMQLKTNEYLSETGHSYYVELDNWINGKILGPGVGDCDFGNMSGGEGKSIDMALKFAMMDVARLQAGSYPDILILDELLDSSIDSYGLEKLVDIVKFKQKEDSLKVFVVSHREEMGEFGYDNLYKVIKENGFSTITGSN